MHFSDASRSSNEAFECYFAARWKSMSFISNPDHFWLNFLCIRFTIVFFSMVTLTSGRKIKENRLKFHEANANGKSRKVYCHNAWNRQLKSFIINDYESECNQPIDLNCKISRGMRAFFHKINNNKIRQYVGLHKNSELNIRDVNMLICNRITTQLV